MSVKLRISLNLIKRLCPYNGVYCQQQPTDAPKFQYGQIFRNAIKTLMILLHIHYYKITTCFSTSLLIIADKVSWG